MATKNISKGQKTNSDKKSTLVKMHRRTRWAPVWIVLKKYGKGKRIHPSRTTRFKRSWKRTKLHIKPRISRKSHLG